MSGSATSMQRTTRRAARRCGILLAAATLACNVPFPANAATASELLEKAIYAEETVGDLDQAIEIYAQVVSAGKEARSAAAQAQFRMGLCYAKQGNAQEAAKAFQAVVDDFPDETALVAQAKARLPQAAALLPAPWQDGEELHLEMKLATGMTAGNQIYRIAKVEREGRTLWQCSSWQNVTLNGLAGKSTVLADLESFTPVESTWKHTLLGEASAHYEPSQVVIISAGKKQPTKLPLEGPVWDNEQAAELFRRLPLEVGYKTELLIITSLASGKVPVALDVSEIETIETPAGAFECFRIDLNIGQTFWISNDANRYIVQFEGGGVTARLSEVRHRKSDENTLVEQPRFQLMLPPDWYDFTPRNDDEDRTSTLLIDPAAALEAKLEAGPLELVQKDHASPEKWLESVLAKYKERLQDFKLGDKGIETTTIGGRPAASAEFTYREKDTPMSAKRFAIFGDSAAVNLRFAMPTEATETWQPDIAKILGSLQVQ